MRARPGIRRPTYGGQDPQMDQFARGTSDALRTIQNQPANDGMKLEGQDFGTQTNPTTQQLKHTMGRKARGVQLLSCKPKVNTAASPAGIPAHCPWLDDDNTAFVAVTADMASNFIWSFWVY